MDNKEEVRSKIDIVDYIGQNVVLKPAGANFKGLCPFHKEKTPSFMVSPDRQNYKCFGCGESGDIFSYYMKTEGVGFYEALKDLAEYAGVKLQDFHPSEDFNIKQKLLEINNTATSLYNFLLTKHHIGKQALEYLNKRGVVDSQISEFQLGYAPQSWQTVTNFLTKKKGFKDNEILQTGLIIKSDNNRYYDRFRGRVIFPLKDIRGNIVGFSGRILPQFDDGKSGKYINTPETSIYHKSELLYPLYHLKNLVRKAKKIVIVEGEMDVLASIRANVSYCSAIKGSALTEKQAKLIKRFCNTIILSLDSDSAGIKAAKKAVVVAGKQDLTVKVVYLRGGKDPDEIIRNSPSKWRELVKNAISVFDFFILIAKEQYDPRTVDGKTAIMKELIPILATIENAVIQEHFIKKLANLLDTEEINLKKEIEKYHKKKQIYTINKIKQTSIQVNDVIQNLLYEFLSIVISFWSDINILKYDFADFPENRTIVKILKLLQKEQPIDLITFAKSLPSQFLPDFDHCFLFDQSQMKKNTVQSTLNRIYTDIAKHSLRDKLSSLRIKHKKSQLNKQKDSLMQDINNILLKLRKYS